MYNGVIEDVDMQSDLATVRINKVKSLDELYTYILRIRERDRFVLSEIPKSNTSFVFTDKLAGDETWKFSGY